MDPILKSHPAGLHCGNITFRLLHQTAATSRQVMHDVWWLLVKPVEIDDVDVRLHARCQNTAVVQSKEF